MWFLSAPYTHENPAIMHARYRVMAEATAYLFREGFNVQSPIVHWHHVSREWDLPTDAESWKKHNLDTLSRCDGMIVLTLPGWEESVGVTMEREWAERKPKFMVNLMSPNMLETYINYKDRGIL